MTFSPFLFSLFYLFILLPPFLFASFFKKKIYSLPGARDVFWGSVFHLKRKALRLCCSASMHVHTCAFSDDLCDTFFFFFLQKKPPNTCFCFCSLFFLCSQCNSDRQGRHEQLWGRGEGPPGNKLCQNECLSSSLLHSTLHQLHTCLEDSHPPVCTVLTPSPPSKKQGPSLTSTFLLT